MPDGVMKMAYGVFGQETNTLGFMQLLTAHIELNASQPIESTNNFGSALENIVQPTTLQLHLRKII